MPWSSVEDLNSFVCQKGGYAFGRTLDGYEPARDLWEQDRSRPMNLMQAAQLCRRCHRLAPFLFLNGNTFANLAKIALEPALRELTGPEFTACRAAIGHYVAGTIGEDELPAFLRGRQ